jgi:class 3 adenylate cyclase/hemoglobin-like flavoprotein/tRNA A-37 threonylcarbamoyl transferase component Bud32
MMRTAIGKYSIVGKIGQGAMGEVYKARDTVLNRMVAVKTIAPAAALRWDESLTERFRREAQAAAGLNHPNIITVHDFGEEDGTFYMAMELLEGSDLSEVVRRRSLPLLADRLGVIEQICDGVAFAHAHRVVHRDLKPANIHLLPNGRVKIMDFGLARSGEMDATRSGGVLGTPYYMAPEQVRGERTDARSDVFSLGALFYELLSGRRAFPAETIHAVLFQVMEREPEPLEKLDPAIPSSLAAVVRKALEKAVDLRYQDAGEMREALRGVRMDNAPAGMIGSLAPAPAVSMRESTGEAERSASAAGSPPTQSTPTLALTRPFRVTFEREEGGDRAVEVSNPGLSLLDMAQRDGIPLFHECGGRARCSTCRVRIVSGAANVHPRTPVEARLASRLGWGDEIRLGCQTRVSGDVAVQRLILDSDDFSLLWFESRQPGAAQETAVAVLSCSLQGFGDFVRKAPPYDVIHLLNRFFLQVGEPVLTNGGTIEKYLGEGLVALFGLAGGTAREKCLGAVRAALRMRARMAELDRYARKHFGIDLRLGVGLHFGRAIVGPVGHPSRMQVTALGDVTTVAGRMVAAGRDGGAQILATEEVINVIEEDVQLGRIFQNEAQDSEDRGGWEIIDLRKPDAVFLTQTTFEEVARRKAEAGALFYELLFEIDPGCRALFSATDMRAQAEMLMTMLAAAVQGLDRMEDLRGTLQDLGRRHAGYGVQLRHYDAVEQALLETIRRMIGDAFTLDVRLAWSRIYNDLARIMLEAAEAPAA